MANFFIPYIILYQGSVYQNNLGSLLDSLLASD